jgi:hypothetical protein
VKSNRVWQEEHARLAGSSEFVAFDAMSAVAGCPPGKGNSRAFLVYPWPLPSDPCSSPHSQKTLMNREIQPKYLPEIAAVLPYLVKVHPPPAEKIPGGCLIPATAARLKVRGDLLGAEILYHMVKSV